MDGIAATNGLWGTPCRSSRWPSSTSEQASPTAFASVKGNKPHLYYLTLFVTDAKLFLLEAGGTKELMTAHAADVTRAVSSFDTTQ